MNKKDVLEIKRRFKKDGNSFDHIAGCYVDAEKNKVVSFQEIFGNLEDDEMHKYLEIANKSLSGTIGNNLLCLEFPTDEVVEGSGGRHDLLMRLRASELKDEAVLNEFYDNVIENFSYVGNYLILLFHDNYDVPLKTTDNMTLDDSEEIYSYLLCAICPVNLSKAGLGYRQDENRIGALLRDWVVAPVDTAFIFPAFTDRSQDLTHIGVYAKNPKDPHKEFWESGLHVQSEYTATEKRLAFESMVGKSLGGDEEENKEQMLDVEEALNDFINARAERLPDEEPVILKAEDIPEIMTESGLSEQKATRIQERFASFFPEEEDAPLANDLLDTRALKNSELRSEKKALQRQVVELTSELKKAGVIAEEGKEVSVVVKVSQEKKAVVETAFVDGRKCLVIPLDEEDTATLNGEHLTF